MPDLIRRCAECQNSFVWTAIQQAASPVPPERCPACARLAPGPGRQRGLVKWYSRSKGYGFITSAAGDEVFVHKSGLAEEQAALCAGQLVEFATVSTDRGAQAAGVVALEAPGESVRS